MSKKIIGFITFLCFLFILGVIRNFFFPKKQPEYITTFNYKNDKIDTSALAIWYREFSDSGKCQYNTINNPVAKGLEMKVFYPCKWEKFDENKDVSYLVNQFVHITFDSIALGLTIKVTPSPVELTISNINKIREEKALKEVTQQYGRFISSAQLTINSILSSETIVTKDNGTFFMIYMLYHKDKIATIIYSLEGKNTIKASNAFARYKSLFRAMIKKTKII